MAWLALSSAFVALLCDAARAAVRKRGWLASRVSEEVRDRLHPPGFGSCLMIGKTELVGGNWQRLK